MEQEGGCQPKDLSMKCHKKLKPIPPPLNLGEHSNALKEFAILATSPKSPLMQKNLPFRKRAHSLSGANAVSLPPIISTKATESINSYESVIVQHVSTPEGGICKMVENFSCASTVDQNGQSFPVVQEEACTSITVPENKANLKSSSISSLTTVIQSQSSSCSPSWSSNLVPLNIPSVSSVLMSPVGSSHEELNNTVNINPWPAPAWHCFQPGTLVKLDMPSGGNNSTGMFRLVEELGSADWVGALKVDQVEDHSALQACIHFCCLGSGIFITAQCHALHTFFVKNKGWCAVYPDQVAMHYHVLCLPLERGDICCPPQTLSPDVCDRFKKFSFPPEDMQMSTPFLISPPSSPCKKPDSDRPKRPMNAFMLFAKRYRLELIQLHPGKDNRAISVILGEAWRKLPAADKQEYVLEARAMAQEQKRLYPDCWKRKRSHSTS